MGSDSAETLMNLLPPVGWADVATKHDLVLLKQDLLDLERRLDLTMSAVSSELRASFRGGLLWMTVAMMTFVAALAVPLVTLT